MNPTPPDLSGHLLVAHPSMRDPNFRRAVVFLCQHEADEGAFGLVLNRPLGRNAAELIPAADPADALARVPVFQGGPVQADRLVFADFAWQSRKKRGVIRHALGLDEVAALVEAGKAARLRGFVGYAGWSAGQVEAEIAQGAWLVVPTAAAHLSLARAERLWADALGSLGPLWRVLATAPDDPSLN